MRKSGDIVKIGENTAAEAGNINNNARRLGIRPKMLLGVFLPMFILFGIGKYWFDVISKTT
jgi:hypothetical protein